MQQRKAPLVHATLPAPTRPAALQETPRTELPTRVLQPTRVLHSARVPQQLCLQFHR